MFSSEFEDLKGEHVQALFLLVLVNKTDIRPKTDAEKFRLTLSNGFAESLVQPAEQALA